MSTTAVVNDLKTTASEILKAIGTALDSILGDASAELAPLSNDGLKAAEAAVENLVPAGAARSIVTSIVTTADAAGHAAIVNALDAPTLALLAIGKANVDSALSKLEGSLTPPAPAPTSSS
jgi:hypothetical protein